MENATRSASVDIEDGEGGEEKRREEKRREEKWVWKKDAKTDEADGDDVIFANIRYKLAASLQL